MCVELDVVDSGTSVMADLPPVFGDVSTARQVPIPFADRATSMVVGLDLPGNVWDFSGGLLFRADVWISAASSTSPRPFGVSSTVVGFSSVVHGDVVSCPSTSWSPRGASDVGDEFVAQ